MNERTCRRAGRAEKEETIDEQAGLLFPGLKINGVIGEKSPSKLLTKVGF
ncbi:hypothetical protein BDA96_08G158100 [Sorghum bicolor]|uniref:Uncharacterized protein n=1 Tax=Sorghum bicolor TaxID=4558 RepID=A0A921U7P5_SORBI|nr:hypothetical protein BDA96_08G158100 [Sorghum bicolor]